MDMSVLFTRDAFYFYILTSLIIIFFFFFNDTATTEIYTLSLHDALPISWQAQQWRHLDVSPARQSARQNGPAGPRDRKSTRLNSSHSQISYAVFCLKKKKQNRLCTCTKRQRNHYNYSYGTLSCTYDRYLA